MLPRQHKPKYNDVLRLAVGFRLGPSTSHCHTSPNCPTTGIGCSGALSLELRGILRPQISHDLQYCFTIAKSCVNVKVRRIFFSVRRCYVCAPACKLSWAVVITVSGSFHHHRFIGIWQPKAGIQYMYIHTVNNHTIIAAVWARSLVVLRQTVRVYILRSTGKLGPSRHAIQSSLKVIRTDTDRSPIHLWLSVSDPWWTMSRVS